MTIPTGDLVEGREYVFMCYADGEQKIHGPRDGYLVVKYDPNRPAAPLDLVDPEFALTRLVAEVKVTPDPPAVRLSPAPPIPQLVGLPMWFWVDGASNWRTKVGYTAPVGDVVATVTATAKTRKALELKPGDGGPSVFCDAPGPAYEGHEDDTNACQYVYTSGSGAAGFPAQLVIHYTVHWTAPGYAGDDLPDIESLPAAVTIPVKGTQAVERNPAR